MANNGNKKPFLPVTPWSDNANIGNPGGLSLTGWSPGDKPLNAHLNYNFKSHADMLIYLQNLPMQNWTTEQPTFINFQNLAECIGVDCYDIGDTTCLITSANPTSPQPDSPFYNGIMCKDGFHYIQPTLPTLQVGGLNAIYKFNAIASDGGSVWMATGVLMQDPLLTTTPTSRAVELISVDGGITWTEPTSLFNFPGEAGVAAQYDPDLEVFMLYYSNGGIGRFDTSGNHIVFPVNGPDVSDQAKAQMVTCDGAVFVVEKDPVGGDRVFRVVEGLAMIEITPWSTGGSPTYFVRDITCNTTPAGNVEVWLTTEDDSLQPQQRNWMSPDGGFNWPPFPLSGFPNGQLHSIHHIDGATVLFYSDGRVVSSCDGGATWPACKKIPSPSQTFWKNGAFHSLSEPSPAVAVVANGATVYQNCNTLTNSLYT